MDHKHNRLIIDNIHDCLNIIPNDANTALERISCVTLIQVIENQISLDNKLNRILSEGVPSKPYRPSCGGPG